MQQNPARPLRRSGCLRPSVDINRLPSLTPPFSSSGSWRQRKPTAQISTWPRWLTKRSGCHRPRVC